MTVKSKLTSLHELDNEQWLEQTINLLKNNRLEALDLEHLIEELEELSLRDKKAVESLVIDKPEDFWKASKYMLIVVE